MKLICRKCGNAEHFGAHGWELSAWTINGLGEAVESNGALGEFKVVRSTIVCENCGAKVKPREGI